MASNTTAADAGLPPDLFDQTTLVSLASTILILAVAYATSLKALAPSTPGSYRFLFIWHAFDALIHFFLEGSFLYHVSHYLPINQPRLQTSLLTVLGAPVQCFFSSIPYDNLTVGDLRSGRYYSTQTGYLGHDDRIWGSQAAGDNPFAQLWLVYARADKRWAGADTVRFWGHLHT